MLAAGAKTAETTPRLRDIALYHAPPRGLGDEGNNDEEEKRHRIQNGQLDLVGVHR